MTFKQFETVRFVGPPTFAPELEYGEVGTVLEVYDDSNFEVEFTFPDGSTKTLQSFPIEYLTKHSPELPLRKEIT